MVWEQCNRKCGHRWSWYNIFNYRSYATIQPRNSNSHSRDCRGHHYDRNHHSNLYHYILVALLSVTPAYAEEPRVHNSSNPVAAATGNVTNQAVQFQNNGAPSRQYFAGGNSCNGPTMTFSPFYMGNDTSPYDPQGYVVNENWGVQLNFSVPLDTEMTNLCKKIARRHEQKLRLDYELIRAKHCTDIMKSGFTFRPGSRVEVLCNDIVPIVSLK